MRAAWKTYPQIPPERCVIMFDKIISFVLFLIKFWLILIFVVSVVNYVFGPRM